MSATQKMPIKARAYILAVILGGAACVAARVPGMANWKFRDLVMLLVLTAAVAVTEHFPIELHHRSENENFSLTEAPKAAGILLAAPGVLVLAVAIGAYIGQSSRRWAGLKVAFNIGQFVISTTVAQEIYALMGSPEASTPSAILAGMAAMAGYFLVNEATVALVISLVEGRSFVEVMRPSFGLSIVHVTGNAAMGVLAGVLFASRPFALPLIILPLVLSFVAYRAIASSLREGNRLRELILENSHDGIFLVDRTGRIASWNPAMHALTGFDAAASVGRHWTEVLRDPGIDHPERESLVRDSVPFPGTSEGPIVDRSGRLRFIHFTANEVRRGRDRATVVVARDMTEQYEAERLKSDFVGMVSHELRSPLTPIKGFLTMLVNGSLEEREEQRREYYDIMLGQANRLERLVTDLLEVSAIQSGLPIIDNDRIELTTLVASQLHEMRRQTSSEIRYAAPGVPVAVTADAMRVEQVVSNLVSNALKYSPVGAPIDVSVSENGGQAVVSVTDSGPGIEPAHLDRIFDRFYRVENGNSRRNGGTGLGLYIARQLVEAMGGRIWVTSTPSAGSTFSFSLPLTEEGAVAGARALAG